MTDATPDTPPPGAGEEKFEGWTWTLFVGKETAIELWRDGELRITVPVSDDQAELLMGHPVSLTGALRDDGLLGPETPGAVMHDAETGEPLPPYGDTRPAPAIAAPGPHAADGKTGGQLAYETFWAQPQTGLGDTSQRWDYEFPGIRKAWEAAAAAVETEQVRLARADRDAVRGRMLTLADELERLADEHMQKADGYDRDAAQENFHRGCGAALRNNAGRIRDALEPQTT